MFLRYRDATDVARQHRRGIHKGPVTLEELHTASIVLQTIFPINLLWEYLKVH